MTVAKPDLPNSIATTNGREVLEGLRRGPQEVGGRPEGLAKSVQQGLAKLKLGEEMAGTGGKGSGQRQKQKSGGGGAPAGKGHTPTAGAAQAASLAPGASAVQGMMAYAYPYGQQLFYYTLPMQYPPGSVGGKPPQPGAGQADSAGRPLPPLVPFAFPPTPYSSPLRPAGPRRPGPVSNGWGGVPLGSQTPAVTTAHPPLRLDHSTAFRGGSRNVAARTVPLPPRRTSYADGSAPPHSPAQADRPSRLLVGSSLSSAASSDGESIPSGRCPSNASVSGGEGLPGAADEGPAQQAEQAQQGAEPAAAAAGPPEAASSRGGGGGGEPGPNSSQGGHQGASAPRGSSKGQQQHHDGHRDERQHCAFFLKTGTCAYGDRCKFEHPYELAPRVEFNSVGLPLRPLEPNCSYYMKYKSCGFGHTCKFHHPELEGTELPTGAGPAFAMQYPYAFPAMPYGYPTGAGIPGQMPPGYMGHPPAAMFPHMHSGQQAPLPFPVGMSPPGPAPLPAPAQLSTGSSTGPAGAPKEVAAPPAAAAVPIPVPLQLARQAEQAQQAAGSPGATPAAPVLEPVSSPRPIMVFGGKSP